MKINIILDKNGKVVGDLDSMDFAMSILESAKVCDGEVTYNIANALVLSSLRVLVKEGKINPYNELFIYNLATDPNLKNAIIVDKNGTLSDYPEGILDVFSDICLKLL